ncbi:MAG: glycosyltransferase family 2 protein [Thermoanaerobaculia bacterium]
MARPRLTVLVTTYNEEANIRECLESVAFADEILLVDSFSSDRTVELARAAGGVRVLQRQYLGSAAQKNWAMDQIESPWILIVDADERVPPALAAEILNVLEAGPRADTYFIRRENIMLDRVIRHSGWSTDKVVRLIRTGTARYPNRRVHADIKPSGPAPVLSEPLKHVTFRSFDQYLEKLHRYAVWGAADLWRQGHRSGPLQLALRPFWRFLRMYVVQAGFLDGKHGFILCALQAYGVFLKWARVWEYQRFDANGWPLDLPAFDETRETWEP